MPPLSFKLVLHIDKYFKIKAIVWDFGKLTSGHYVMGAVYQTMSCQATSGKAQFLLF